MHSRDFPLALAFPRKEETEKTATQARKCDALPVSSSKVKQSETQSLDDKLIISEKSNSLSDLYVTKFRI